MENGYLAPLNKYIPFSDWGTKDSWKGPYDIKAMVVISLSHLI
jgi:hypothetical protein